MKHPRILVLSLFAVSANLFGCGYDDSDTTEPRDPNERVQCAESCKATQYCVEGTMCVDKMSAGKDCSHDLMCLSGACKKSQCTCTDASPCGDDQYCSNALCYDKLALDMPCTENIECVTGYCDSKKCATPHLGGDICISDAMCQTGECDEAQSRCTCREDVGCTNGMYCQNDTCVAKLVGGSACQSSEMCQSNACVNSVCVDPLLEGETCTSDNECKSQLCNNITKKCACESDDDCADGKYCISESKTCDEKRLGEATCTTDNQCLSGACDDGLCECSIVRQVTCLHDMVCAKDNACYGQKEAGTTCTLDGECASRWCVKSEGASTGTCQLCDDSNACPNGASCDSGVCREIVACPNASDKKCVVTAQFHPNKLWDSGNLSNAIEDARDYQSSNYDIAITSKAVNFCVKVSEVSTNAIISLIQPLLEINAANLTVSEKNALVYAQFPTIMTNLTEDALKAYLQAKPYVWAVFYELDGCKDMEEGAACLGTSSTDVCRCTNQATKLVPTPIPAYSETLFDAYYAPYKDGDDATANMMKKQKLIMLILQNLMDKRLFYRLEDGCIERQMGVSYDIMVTPKSGAKAKQFYVALQYLNSSMMGDDEEFDLSMTQINTASQASHYSSEKVTESYGEAHILHFPLESGDSGVLSMKADPKIGSDPYIFTTKPTYHQQAAIGSDSSYAPIYCDDYYTMSFDKGASFPKQYCASESSCNFENYDEAQASTENTCHPTVFMRLDSLKVYTEVE